MKLITNLAFLPILIFAGAAFWLIVELNVRNPTSPLTRKQARAVWKLLASTIHQAS